MARPHDDRSAFRCSVSPENSAAKLKIGRQLFAVSILDTSRSGFSVRVPKHVAKKLKSQRGLQLIFAGEEWEVSLESRYSGTDDFDCVGFSRIRELTKIKEPSSWGLSFLPKINVHSDPTFLAFLMLAFLLAVICLPGVGDKLGTAPKVRKGLNNLYQSLTDTIK